MSDSSVETGKRRRLFNWRAVLLSLWSAWIVATLGTALTITGGGVEGNWNYIPYAVFNLFTPVLLGNLKVVPVLLMFGGLVLGELVGRHIRWTVPRLIYNLAFLAMLTALTDVVVWGSWISLSDFRHALHF